MELQNVIREIREGLGMTQVQFAIRLGVSPSAVYTWERKTDPRTMRVRNLARLLDVASEDQKRIIIAEMSK